MKAITKTAKLATIAMVHLAAASLLTTSSALAQGQPSAKATAKVSNETLIPETTGTGDYVTILCNTIKTPEHWDMFITPSLEVGLYTRTEAPPESEATASVQVRVLVDGNEVEPGPIAYSRRLQHLDADSPTDLTLDTMEASAFSYVDVDVPVGVHEVCVQARVDTDGSGTFTAFGKVGKGTVTVEKVRMIKDEDVLTTTNPAP